MFGVPRMLVLSVNKTTEFAQILIYGAKYTCATKEENGRLLFRFKDKWYPLEQFTNEHTKYFD